MKTTFVTLILFFIGYGVYALSQPPAPEYITTLAERGDLVQKVEIVGAVVSERDLQLQFARSGIVSVVHVDEGNIVQAGQTLAQLRANDLLASIQSERARLESAQAELATLEEGTRPEDIAIAEAELKQKKASLALANTSLQSSEDNLRRSEEKLAQLERELNTNLQSQIFAISSLTSKELTDALSSLRTLEDIRSDPDIEFSLESQSYAYAQSLYEQLRRARELLQKTINEQQTLVDSYDDAIFQLQQTRLSIKQAGDTMFRWYQEIADLPEINRFNRTEREEAKTSIAAEQTKLQTGLKAVDTELRSLQDNAARYQTSIASEKSNVTSAKGTRDRALVDIATFESSIAISEAQLALKRAGSRPSDIEAARARVRQQQGSLARAQAEYADSLLRAPISGTVTAVNVQPGEFTPAGPAITMLGESPYRIEVFVPEIDIPKISLSQTGYVLLEAFPGIDYDLTVSEIDPAATNRDGVPKYRVVLDFVYKHDVFKIGMTGDVDIHTNSRSDVVFIPSRAVIQNAEGQDIVRILENDTMLERVIVLGMEGEGGNVEIVDGVEEGEVVVVLIKE